jgi:hypothetical protein
MTEKIEKVLMDKVLQNELVKWGKLRAPEFTWQKSALRSKEIYENLV